MNTPATPEQSNSPFDMTKIKTTAIILLAIGCLILPIGIANFVHARPYCFAAPFFCIALAVAIFAKKPKAIPYIFVANLVLEIPRLIYHFWDCFQCEYLVHVPEYTYDFKSGQSIDKGYSYYRLDDLRLATCVLLSVSCFLLILSTICTISYLCAKKRETVRYSNSAAWSLFLLGLSYAVSEAAYIVQLANTANGYQSYALPIDIIIIVFNAIIGIMLTRSIYNLFCLLPDIEQLAKEDATKRTKPFTNEHRPVAVPAPTPVAQPRVPVNVADEIMKYKQLLDMGAITQEEYDQKKTELLHTNS